MQKIIVIAGPTGVGKTKLSIALAKKYNGEIINADSMQVYKELNIGTAKIKDTEKENIPHHLFDIKNIDEEYTIYHYQKDIRNKIDEINKRNKRIIIVGGTALYLKAGLFDYTLEENSSSRDLSSYTDKELVNELKKLDKNIDIDFNNRRRVERAYNYYLDNNKSISENTSGNNLLYPVIFNLHLLTIIAMFVLSSFYAPQNNDPYLRHTRSPRRSTLSATFGREIPQYLRCGDRDCQPTSDTKFAEGNRAFPL